MIELFDAPLAIVDLETTGAHPAWDRVTEIAVIEVDGGEVSSEWSTLVNPETTIPPAIRALTGITNAMVAGAPRFDLDQYKILARHLGKGRARVVDLPARASARLKLAA